MDVVWEIKPGVRKTEGIESGLPEWLIGLFIVRYAAKWRSQGPQKSKLIVE